MLSCGKHTCKSTEIRLPKHDMWWLCSTRYVRVRVRVAVHVAVRVTGRLPRELECVAVLCNRHCARPLLCWNVVWRVHGRLARNDLLGANEGANVHMYTRGRDGSTALGPRYTKKICT